MRRLKTTSRWLLGGVFIAAGANHFANAPLYLRIMPPYVPYPELMVQLSGVAECTLGAAVLAPRTRAGAAWGLIALLLAVFPANVEMAQHPQRFAVVPPVLLWARLPLQAVLIAWAWWHTRTDD